jgi:hypothetical protein
MEGPSAEVHAPVLSNEIILSERSDTMSQRGIFEKMPGSDDWWIRYADATGRIRRE